MYQMDKWGLVRLIQEALREQAGITGASNFYDPSPGQTWDHVHNRVARIAADAIWPHVEEAIEKG